uniref:Uncharacterized protein n=1 Tax=Globodera rostochiensis TaxID=31243 RepID=A0A914H158_GLORO
MRARLAHPQYIQMIKKARRMGPQPSAGKWISEEVVQQTVASRDLKQVKGVGAFVYSAQKEVVAAAKHTLRKTTQL